MKNDPIVIPDDILAKFGHEIDPADFDRVLGSALAIPAADVPRLEDEPKRPVGRPRKDGP